MELLTDDLRQQLPRIRTFHSPTDENQYVIYAKFFTPHSGVTFYVAEGEERKSDYLFWGFLIVPRFRFPSRFEITLRTLQSRDWLGQEPCQRDEDFHPTIWGKIEPNIPNLHPPP
jgi:hypothetical protein